VKYKGKVIDYLESAKITNPKFAVSQAGRKRALKSKNRNVHAFIVCDDYQKLCKNPNINKSIRVSYNPFKFSDFYRMDGDTMIKVEKSKICYLREGKAYVNAVI
jgi:hypothetical protein